MMNKLHQRTVDRFAQEAFPSSPSRVVCAWVMACTLVLVPAWAAPTVLAPLHAGQFDKGTGADAAFLKIPDDWHASAVLWNESTQSYGSGTPIGGIDWGTGLWGRADWQTAQDAARGTGGPFAPSIVNSWSGQVSAINFADVYYNRQWSATWGAVPLAPLFRTPSDGQNNWTAHFSGFVRIETPGEYDFSVLNDDGFFFDLTGADATVETGRDFLNPRDRNGFGEFFALSTGLYGFELGAWDRLEAGAIDLRWRQKDTDPWTLVPTENLLPPNAIPEPSVGALLALGLGALTLSQHLGRRRKSSTP